MLRREHTWDKCTRCFEMHMPNTGVVVYRSFAFVFDSVRRLALRGLG